MKRISLLCLTLLLSALVLGGCGGIKFSFDITKVGNKVTVKVNDIGDGETTETDYVSIGKGRSVFVESQLEKGQLQIDIAEATVYTHADPDQSDDIYVGDVVESITVGPGDTAQVSLKKGDYVYQLKTIGQTSGKVVLDVKKE